uniref:GTPase IMAP family member 8 n=1 Tax=Scleropages formosus TaxID=113540 RepID=A0A8C9VE10_SCLFO
MESLNNRRNSGNNKITTQNFGAGPETQRRIPTGHGSKYDDSVTQRMRKPTVCVQDMENVKSLTQKDNRKHRVTQEVKLVLLGRRGSGKSSCGNTILGAKVFQSFLSTTPVTRECEEHSTHIQGRKVTVIDTPDFFGDFLPDPDFHVKKCISMVGQESSVFLLVIQLGRFTEGEKKIVTQIQEVFSVSVTQNMIVLFSYGDDLEGVTTEDFLKHAQPELRTLVEKCGNRYHVFNNRDTSSDTQVTELLQKVNCMLDRPKEQ